MKRREYRSPKICINKDAGYRGIGPTIVVVMIVPVIVSVSNM